MLFTNLMVTPVLFLWQEKQGATPRHSEMLERIPHYYQGKFCNLAKTPLLFEGLG